MIRNDVLVVGSGHHGTDGAMIELYNDMDVFVPELGFCEPRPWHADLPQKPKHWPITEMTDLATAALGGQSAS